MLGENWFAAGFPVELGKSIFYNVVVQTPAYVYDSRRYAATPVYGDHIMGTGSEFAYAGLYYDEVAEDTASIDEVMLPTNYMLAKRNPEDSAATASLLHVKSIRYSSFSKNYLLYPISY